MGRFQEWRERQRLASDLAAKVLGTQPYFDSGRQGEMVHPLWTWLDQAVAGLGAEHDVTLELRYRLAAALRATGATGAVAESAEQAAAVVAAREQLGMSQVLLQAWVLYADALDNQGRHNEAADAWGALGEYAAGDLDRRDVVRIARAQRAAALCHAERFAEAEQEGHRLLESAATTTGSPGVSVRLSGLILLSVALTGQGRAMEAESAARQGLVIASSEGGPQAATNAYVLHVNLAAALDAQGRPAEALDLLAAVLRPPRLTAEAAAATAITQSRALLALGRPAEATAVLQSALSTVEPAFGPHHVRLRELHTLHSRASLGNLTR
jgi:tetratricopeptide (TPR) repeat protein